MTAPAIPVNTASARMALMSTNVCVLRDTQVCCNQKNCKLNELMSIIRSVLDAYAHA